MMQFLNKARSLYRLGAVLCLATTAIAAEDGLARSPIMGWRNWNTFGADITQTMIEDFGYGMTVRRCPNGERCDEGVSLLELGYFDVGLDDNWQACDATTHTFHDKSGRPLINATTFPNLKAMVDVLHGYNLTASWYHNNCICKETKAKYWPNLTSHYVGDVEATTHFGFDGVKLDGCGLFLDLQLWYDLLRDANKDKSIYIENCHWGQRDLPYYERNGDLWCPYHQYRSSGDIFPTWKSMFHNLNTLPRFLDKNLSVPGCWAHPDGLEVGNLEDALEDRAHFGAWAVTSSPLILAHDVNDDEISERVWPIVANTDAIRINQQYVDEAGRLAAQWNGIGGQRIQIWTKRLPESQSAIFVINDNPREIVDVISIAVDHYFEGSGERMKIYDVWAQEYLDESFDRSSVFEFELSGHDSLFFRLEPTSDDILSTTLL